LLTLVLTQTLRHGPREGIKVAFSPLLTDGPVLVASILALSWIQAYPAPWASSLWSAGQISSDISTVQ
jgi:threonine/homoserine/homoserine lactone efflux protein